MADAFDMSFLHEAHRSSEKEKVFANPPLPETYAKVTLAVEEDGTTRLILSSSTSEGRAEKESVEFTPHSPTEPIHIGGSDYVPACREDGERKETQAREFMVNAPPSLPPSPPPIHMDEVQGRPGGVCPSQPPEGHELEDRDEVESGSDSGKTDATDNDFTTLARNAHDDTAAPMRPITPVTELRFDQGWRVRLCQTPKSAPHYPLWPVQLRLQSHSSRATTKTRFSARLRPDCYRVAKTLKITPRTHGITTRHSLPRSTTCT
eukprot:522095-Pleurochrysis_carterae.AAC.1